LVKVKVLFLVFLSISFSIVSQTDSIIYSEGLLKEGFYLTYNDFRKNSPISKQVITSEIKKETLDFYGKTAAYDKLVYVKNETTFTVQTASLWGFYQNNALYINYNNTFYRIPVFGAISYLIATVNVKNYDIGGMGGFYDPIYGPAGFPTQTKELRDFIVNFYDGKMIEFTLNNAEALLSRDKELFSEYKKLRNRKQREQINSFIRRYNTSHAIHFIK
jgi:hypothetical protein